MELFSFACRLAIDIRGHFNEVLHPRPRNEGENIRQPPVAELLGYVFGYVNTENEAIATSEFELPVRIHIAGGPRRHALTRPSIGACAGLGIAHGPLKVRRMRQVVGEVMKEVLTLACATNDGFSGGSGIRAPAVTGSSSRGTSKAKLPG